MTESDQVAEASAQYLSETTGQVVPGGYKQTEAGAIPENWYCCNLGDALTLQRGFDLPQRLRNEGNVPIISSSGENGKHNKAMVAAPGIVTGRYGTIGEIFYIQEPFWPLNTTLYVSKFIQTSAEYAYYLLQTVDFDSHSGKSGVPGVNRNDVHQEKIAIPPIPEQTAIANALFDVDALIDELEKLIAKKQAIKTATMQQLLTGRTRLPPFALREDGTQKGYKQSELGEIPEDWKIITIDEALADKLLLDHMDGNHGELYPKSHEFSSFGVPYIGATDFDSGRVNYKTCKYLPIARAKKFKKGIAKDGDVLFAHNATVGPVALMKTELEFVIISTTATYYRCDLEMLNNKYLAKFFESKFFVKQYSAVMSQSTRNQVPILAQRKFSIVLPTIKEQTAIATILSDMDTDIQTLQQRLSKTRQIKQGMMQELLTGKIRLIKPEPDLSANDRKEYAQ